MERRPVSTLRLVHEQCRGGLPLMDALTHLIHHALPQFRPYLAGVRD
jgi:hypothetical protein